MVKKQTRTVKLKADIEIRDVIIQKLIKVLADNKIGLPEQLIGAIEIIYGVKTGKDNDKE